MGLVTGSIGRVDLVVPGFPAFMCTVLSYRMAINEVPTARITVAGGRSVRHPASVSRPEDLLIALNSNDTALVPCELRETAQSGAYAVIFRGYLVDGGAHYSAGDGGGAASITFTCLGLAAALMVTPGAQYIEAPVNDVLDTVMYDSKDVGIEAALRSNNRLQSMQQSLNDLYEYTEHLPLVKRIATLVKGVRASITPNALMSFLKSLLDDPDGAMDADVLRVFGGKARLREETLPTQCLRQFSEDFTTRAMNAISGGSVWDAVHGCLASPDFALELTPRWSCDVDHDFRIEIKPITAWHPRTVTALDASDIIAFDASRNSLAAVNTPDILVVRLADPRSMQVNAAQGQTADNMMFAGVRGVAAKDPALNARLRAHIAGSSFMSDVSAMGKVRQMEMPPWCAVMPPASSSDDQKQQELANRIAETCLQYHYRAFDNATLRLSPWLRFGMSGRVYEDRLGDRVVVTLANNASSIGRGLTAYGCLNAIEYEYAASPNGSSASYSWQLSRVMYVPPGGGAAAWSAGTLDMDSPIYES